MDVHVHLTLNGAVSFLFFLKDVHYKLILSVIIEVNFLTFILLTFSFVS